MESHEGEYHEGKWLIKMSLGDELHTYVIPFDMVSGELYMCYVWSKKARMTMDWPDAKMVMLRFEGLFTYEGYTQPRYCQADQGQDASLIGPVLVIPFKRLGPVWPPEEGNEPWM